MKQFKNEPPPPFSCRRSWNRLTPGNEFFQGRQTVFFLRRATCRGNEWAISLLAEQTDWLVEQVARRHPDFVVAFFERLLADRIAKSKRVTRNGER